MGNIDFRVVQNPQSASQGVDRFSQGLSGLGQVMDQRDARAKEEAFANSPINPLQVQMLELMKLGQKRVGAGEDPVQVAAELKQHPIAQQYLQAAKGGGLAAPAMGQAQPAQVPQQAAPQLETPPPPPAYPAGYGQPQQSLGAPPRGPVSGALNMSPQPVTQAWDKLSAAPVSLGNTQPPRPEFGSQMQPAVSQRPAPQQAPVPQAPTAPPQYTQRDYASVQGMFPTLLAAQGRNDAAQIRADVQREISIRQNDTATFKALLQQQGMDADRASRESIEFAKLGDSERKNVLDNLTRVKTTWMNNATDIEVAGINAGSRERVAEGKNEAKADTGIEKELLKVQDGITTLTKNPEWFLHPASLEEMRKLNERREELRKGVGRGTGQVGAPSSPQFTMPAAKAKPSSTPAMKAPASGGKIKVRRSDGKVGLISPQFFDPKTMTKL